MVFNVLWLSAVAAAAMVSGFCMGRLTVKAGDSSEEESGGDRRLQRRSGWEMETAGDLAVRVDSSQWETGGENTWIRRANRAGRETVAEQNQNAAVKVSGMQLRAGVRVRPDRSMDGIGSLKVGQDGVSKPVRTAAASEVYGREKGDVAANQLGVHAVVSGVHGKEGLRTGAAGRIADAARSVISTNSRQLRAGRRFHRGRTPQLSEGKSWEVGSPVTGYVTSYREGDHPTVMICPDEDRLYAPAAGKIIRLFPMGNAFLLRTEFGVELYIRVGESSDDLLGRYYRPRVVQNEIVCKGKLLLEFDRQGLGAEGATAMVTVTVENRAYGSSVTMTADEKIRVGEELLQVTERPEPGSGRVE